jgi:hypothetical protein
MKPRRIKAAPSVESGKPEWTEQIYHHDGSANAFDCLGDMQSATNFRDRFNYFNGRNALV